MPFKDTCKNNMDDVLDGIPQYQVRKAQALGLTEPIQINAFVLDNADQPDEVGKICFLYPLRSTTPSMIPIIFQFLLFLFKG